ncbi:MAG: redoxin domain-containing protein [Bryobacteraceae bacterium]
MRFVLCLLICGLASASGPSPFDVPAKARVLLFVRTDCPLTNRYAPELRRISQEFATRGVTFWLVYPGKSELEKDISTQVTEYGLPGTVVRDTDQSLVKLSHAIVSPEAAVFDAGGKLRYHGRIDDQWSDFGKGHPTAQSHDLEDAIADVLANKVVAHPETHAVGCALADVE